MSTPNRSRAVRDAALADALAAGLSYRAAAEQSGYSLATVQRRMKDPGFSRRVEEVRRGRFTAINDRLQSGAVEAADYLVTVVRDEQEATSQRVRAASSLLSQARAYKETTDQEERIQEIESLLADELARGREEARQRG